MNPLLFISALIIGPIIGTLVGTAIGLWWANRPANDSRREAQERSNKEWQAMLNRSRRGK